MLGQQVRINILGAFEVDCSPSSSLEGNQINITAAKLRQVLALLAASAGSPVGTDFLIDELWPSGPPTTVKTVVQTYIYQLRKIFAGSFSSPCGAKLLVTRPGGYVLAVPRSNIDIFQFQALAAEGKRALGCGQVAHAADLLRRALTFWRGSLPPDITSGPSLCGLSTYLEEKHLETLSLRIEADLADGRHSDVIGELKSLVSTHRLHETFYLQLMQALHECGRRCEGLTTYQSLRRVLDEELGLEPSTEAKKLQQKIIVGG